MYNQGAKEDKGVIFLAKQSHLLHNPLNPQNGITPHEMRGEIAGGAQQEICNSLLRPRKGVVTLGK